MCDCVNWQTSVNFYNYVYFKNSFKKGVGQSGACFFSPLSAQETEAEDDDFKASVGNGALPYCSPQTQKT